MQFPVEENQLETIILHTSGQWISERFYMKPSKSDPQAYGSVITYQRRYALSAILGLNTDEDDDGNRASTEKAVSEKTVSKKPELIPGSEKWGKAVEFLKKEGNTLEMILKNYSIKEENKEKPVKKKYVKTSSGVFQVVSETAKSWLLNNGSRANKKAIKNVIRRNQI
jgi:ribosome-binding ATPase YchF (GTP1/OBG family)